MAYNKNGPHSTLGPSHTGGAKPGFFAKPDRSDALHTHHEQPHIVRGQEHAAADGSLARTSKIAKLHPHVPVGLGQRSRTSPLPGMLTMTDVHGVPDAANPSPLDVVTPSQAGKRLSPPKVHDGCKTAPGFVADHRLAEGADAVMREGIAAAEPDHPVKMAARLPQATTEET